MLRGAFCDLAGSLEVAGPHKNHCRVMEHAPEFMLIFGIGGKVRGQLSEQAYGFTMLRLGIREAFLQAQGFAERTMGTAENLAVLGIRGVSIVQASLNL